MARFITAEQAANMIPSGATVTVSGLVGAMVPEPVLEALERRFLATGEPRDITEIHPWLYGAHDGSGLNHWAHEGLLKTIIGSTYILPATSKTSEINRMVIEDRVEGHCWPANAIFQMLRAVGAGRPGYMTPVAVDTFADPRRNGGRLNASAKPGLVDLVEVAGVEQLFYHSIPIDFAIIRASAADGDGNISCEDEGNLQGILTQATAARNSGGTVIVEVRRLVETGSIHPLMVELPGILVDYIVVNPDAHQWQYGTDVQDEGATTGRYRAPVPEYAWVGHSAEKIVARRALMEVKPGNIVNVGAGSSSGIVPAVSMEEQVYSRVTWSAEHGVLGGVGYRNGCNWNPTAITTPAWLLDFYNGKGLDQAFLTLPEIDRFGNINNVKLGDQLPCPGGFVDIAYNTPKVTFCGTFTRNGLDANIEEGRLDIRCDGRPSRFVQDVEMVAFSGNHALKAGQEVLYVTERAVFTLTPDGLELLEIAPGVDLDKHVLELIPFPVKVSPNLKLMDERLFRPEPMFLGLER